MTLEQEIDAIYKLDTDYDYVNAPGCTWLYSFREAASIIRRLEAENKTLTNKISDVYEKMSKLKKLLGI